MNKLKKAIFGKCMKKIIINLIVGSIFLAMGIPAWKAYKTDAVDFESLDFSKNLSGTYVKGTLEFVYDCYCEETQNNKVSSRYYIIDAGDEHYMSLHVVKSDLDEIEALMQASWDYMDGKSTLDTLLEHRYEFEGVISSLASDTLIYYNQYMAECGIMPTKQQTTFLPYTLEFQTKTSRLIFFSAFGITAGIFYLIALIRLLGLFTGFYTRAIKKYIKNSTNPTATKEKVEHFLQNTNLLHDVYCNEDFICGFHGCSAMIGETRKIVWAYQFTINHKYAGIFTYKKENSLMVYFHDSYFAHMGFDIKKALHVSQLIGRLSRYCPWMIEGYSDELLNMYTKDRNAFLNLRYNPWHEEQAKKDPFYNSDTTNSTNVY
ncbi:MAG: hypothetical protein IKL04_00505 [Lachnospiraceae bacterium]|nr:hypothetical protein [Lachnospiraceae bacterium]